MTTTATLKARIAAALERSSMGPGYIGEVLEALDPIITEVTQVTEEHRDRANRLARAHVDTADEIDTKVKAAVVAAFRHAARDWDLHANEWVAAGNNADELRFAAAEASNRAALIEAGEVDL